MEGTNLISISEDPVKTRLERALTEDEDKELKDLLKQYKLANLYEKYRGLGVTVDIFWDLKNDSLQKNGFNEIELMRISKARQIHEKQCPTRPGISNLMFTSG